MKVFLLLLPLFIFSCKSFDAETVAQEICNCNQKLVEVNEEIKHSVDSGSQREVMALFTKAGQIQEQSKLCILNLSNTHGKIDKKQYQAILKELEKQCREAVEPFEKSGWYQDETNKH